MEKQPLPILYSFRRCPYAMRARLALLTTGTTVELREIVLRDKPAAMIETSPKATVPVLVLPDDTVIDESREIAEWALSQHDPHGWLNADRAEIAALIDHNDGPFKQALDRYKYPNRYDGEEGDRHQQRALCAATIENYEARLRSHSWLLGDNATWADYAVLPFVRQFAHVDRNWFWAQNWPHVVAWLDAFLASDLFQGVMEKRAPWQPGADPVLFTAAAVE
ncbi:MAG: glutathione S-transferase [Ahrensia sp.]